MDMGFKINKLAKIGIFVAISFTLALTLNFIDDVFIDNYGERPGEGVVIDIIFGVQESDSVSVRVIATVLDTVTVIDTVFIQPDTLGSVDLDVPNSIKIPGTGIVIFPK